MGAGILRACRNRDASMTAARITHTANPCQPGKVQPMSRVDAKVNELAAMRREGREPVRRAMFSFWRAT